MTIDELVVWRREHSCDNPQPIPLDLLFGGVEIHGEVEIRPGEDPPFDYEPSGWTEIYWDGATTVGLVCAWCGEIALVDEWVSEVVG